MRSDQHFHSNSHSNNFVVDIVMVINKRREIDTCFCNICKTFLSELFDNDFNKYWSYLFLFTILCIHMFQFSGFIWKLATRNYILSWNMVTVGDNCESCRMGKCNFSCLPKPSSVHNIIIITCYTTLSFFAWHNASL